MKRINFVIYFIFASLCLFGCKDDKIVDPGGDDITVDYGDVEALFEMKLLTGELVDTVDMGDVITMSDISLGRPDKREWLIKSNDGSVVVNTSKSKVQTLFFPEGDKDYDVTLKVTRSSDNAVDEIVSSKCIHVRKVDVTADFLANAEVDTLSKIKGGGDYMVGRGKSITFLNNSKGVPNNLTWEFEQGTPLTSDKNDINVVYNKDGLYTAKLIATRISDGSTSVVTKQIRVIQKYLNIQTAIVDNRTVTLTYDQDVMADPSVAKNEITVKILTAAGGTLSAGIESISSANKVLTIVLDQDTYHNDIVTLSYNGESSILKGKDPAYIARTMENYGLQLGSSNVLNSLTYDSDFEKTTDADYGSAPWVANNRNFNKTIKGDIAASGSKSMYIEIGVNAGNVAMDFLPTRSFTGINVNEKYHFGMWVYVLEISNTLSGSLWWMNNNDWSGARSIGSIPNNITLGKWTFITGSAAVTARAMTNNLQRINIRFVGGGVCKFYMDHMVLFPESTYRPRP